MSGSWGVVFAASTAIALVATPLLRKLAISIGLVDDPADRKHHKVAVPYLGGVAVIIAALVGVGVGRDLAPRLAVIAIAAAVVGVVGLLDDDKVLNPLPRLIAQFGAAGAVVAIGVRAHATGIEGVDIALTIVWIVGITNAMNLVDNMDALGGGTALASAAGVFTIAAMGGQDVVATVAAGLAGACVGFLAYNLPPASIFLGDAGSLFLGFLLAIAALEVDPNLGEPASFLVPLLLLGIPVLDTATVVIARLRHGRPVSAGARDHLSHRLVKGGATPGRAVAFLIAVQFLFSATAVFHGRGVLRTAFAVGIGAALVALVVVRTSAVRIYREPTIGLPKWFRWSVLGGIGAVAVLSVPATLALASARADIRAGAAAAEDALAAATGGDTSAAARDFDRAAAAFGRAGDRLDHPIVGLGRLVPVLASNLEAGRGLSAAGGTVATAGKRLTERVDPGRLGVSGGALPLAEIDRVAPEFERAADDLASALAIVAGLHKPYLLPEVEEAVTELEDRLTSTVREVSNSALAARLAPAIFGANGPRRYFLAIQNPSEARATGGFIGNWGELAADGGRLSLQRFERLQALNESGGDERSLHAPPDFVDRYARFGVESTWQNINLSPDFPTVAAVIGDLYGQSGGSKIDGVIAVDPHGLAALLELTGAIEVPGWPEPISAGNVVEVTLRDAYAAFEDRTEREDFLGVVAEETWRRFTTSDLGDPPAVASVLSGAVAGRHLQLNLVRPEEQALVEVLRATGATPPARADSLLVVNQNAGGNKLDYYLDRTIRYHARLTPGDGGVNVNAKLEVTLDNRAPLSGLPPEVAGPYDERFSVGENRSYLSIYTPLELLRVEVDGEQSGMESEDELGRNVYSKFVTIPAGRSRTVTLHLAGHVGLGEGGWYGLDLVRQPVHHEDQVAVDIEMAPGWRLADTINLEPGTNGAAATLDLASDTTVWARVERSGTRGWWDRLWQNR